MNGSAAHNQSHWYKDLERLLPILHRGDEDRRRLEQEEMQVQILCLRQKWALWWDRLEGAGKRGNLGCQGRLRRQLNRCSLGYEEEQRRERFRG